jgi:hypothetical protein
MSILQKHLLLSYICTSYSKNQKLESKSSLRKYKTMIQKFKKKYNRGVRRHGDTSQKEEQKEKKREKVGEKR